LSVKYYINKCLFFFTTPLLVALLYVYGNKAAYFDYIYIAALSLSCFFCIKDKDTLAALIVLLGYWCLAKFLIHIPDTPSLNALVYVSCFWIAIYYFHVKTAKILLVITCFSIGAEYYWWISEYEHKPKMIYWTSLLAVTVWLRQLLFNRVIIMHNYFGYTSGKMGLDHQLGTILLAYYVLVLLMVAEYFARHLTGSNELLFIYNLFTPVATLISATTLAVVYMHYFNNESKKYLAA
jgi:hypothetical protein